MNFIQYISNNWCPDTHGKSCQCVDMNVLIRNIISFKVGFLILSRGKVNGKELFIAQSLLNWSKHTTSYKYLLAWFGSGRLEG